MFKQFEILLEGINPDSGGPLSPAEIARVQTVLQPGEALLACARGRVVGRNSSLWVLSAQALHMIDEGRRAPLRRVALAEITALDSQSGRYGHTLGVVHDGRRRAIFGAHSGLARHVVQTLAQLLPGLAVPVEPALREREVRARALQTLDAARWVMLSRQRLTPGQAQTQDLMQAVGVLQERGWISAQDMADFHSRLEEAA